MSGNRIYVVRSAAGNERMVLASSRSQALRYVAQGVFEVFVARPMDVADLMKVGIRLEEAGADRDEEGGE